MMFVYNKTRTTRREKYRIRNIDESREVTEEKEKTVCYTRKKQIRVREK